MHPFKQLLRQPVRTIAALIILTASAAFMCLSWGVYRSGLATAKAVDDSFTTLMAYDDDYLAHNRGTIQLNMINMSTGEIKPEDVERPLLYVFEEDGTFDKISQTLPQSDSLRGIFTHRYMNAFIPDYIPLISTVEGYRPNDLDTPYNSAVLVFKATDIKIEKYWLSDDLYVFTVEGDIIARPAFNEQYTKTDRIRLSTQDKDYEQLEMLKADYEVGKTYIVNLPCEYSDFDLDAKLRIADRVGVYGGVIEKVSIKDIDWSTLEIGPEKILTYDTVTLGEEVGGVIKHNGHTFGISKDIIDMLGYCGSNSFQFPYAYSPTVTFNFHNIAEVPGTLDEFLADPENKIWVDYINNINETLNATTVYGTDNINSLLLFADKTMYLSDGEAFSAEDYEKGNSVCIVSESAAYKNGWSVGDKITLNYYRGVPNVIINFTKALPGKCTSENNLAISCEYEIKGIYRHTNIFSGDPADITPNTVFVPNKNFDDIGLIDAIETAEDKYKFYSKRRADFDISSMIVKNGRIDDMKAFIEEQGWDVKWFKFFDGGYSEVQGVVEGMKDSADDQLLASGLTAITALIIYIALFVMRQRKNVGTMLSLGSGKTKAAGFMIVVSTIPAAIATALGAMIGCAMLRSSVSRVISEASQQFDTAFSGTAAMGHASLENTVVLPSAAVIAAFALLAVYIVAFVIASIVTVSKNPRNLMKK